MVEELSHGYAGYNIRFYPIKDEEQGPVIGWISHEVAEGFVDHIDLSNWFADLYSRFHIQLTDRKYKQMAWEFTHDK
jgi:hypothetical protein